MSEEIKAQRSPRTEGYGRSLLKFKMPFCGFVFHLSMYTEWSLYRDICSREHRQSGGLLRDGRPGLPWGNLETSTEEEMPEAGAVGAQRRGRIGRADEDSEAQRSAVAS